MSPELTLNLHPTSRNVADEDDVTAAKDDLDGETGTESDTDSDVVVLNARPIQYRAGRPDSSEAGNPSRHLEDVSTCSKASFLNHKGEPREADESVMVRRWSMATEYSGFAMMHRTLSVKQPS